MSCLFRSALVFFLWTQCISTDALTHVTNLTFVPQLLTWHDARKACHHMGGHLIEILDETKNNVISNFAKEYKTSLDGSGSISIGSATLTPREWDHFWSESCLPVVWANWHPDELSSPGLRRSCVKLDRSNGLWKRGNCDQARQYTCEKSSGDICPYERRVNTSLLSDNIMFKISTSYVSSSHCSDTCDTSTLNGGVECWAFHFITVTQKCTIFYTTHPYLASDDQYLMNNTEGTLYIKQCYYGKVGEPYNLTTSPTTDREPQFDCTNVSSVNMELTQSASTTPAMTSDVELVSDLTMTHHYSGLFLDSSESIIAITKTTSTLTVSSTNFVPHSYDILKTSLTAAPMFSFGNIISEPSVTDQVAFSTTEQGWSVTVQSTDFVQHSYNTLQTSLSMANTFLYADLRPESFCSDQTAFAKAEQDWSVPLPSTDLTQHSYDSLQTFTAESRFSSADIRPESSGTDQTAFATKEQDWSVPVPSTDFLQSFYNTLQTTLSTDPRFSYGDIRSESSCTGQADFSTTAQDLSVSVPPTNLIQHSYDTLQTSFITNFKFPSADIRPETSGTYETAFAKTEQDLSVSVPPTDLIQHSYNTLQTSFTTNFKFPSADIRPETSGTYETAFAKTEQDLSVSAPPTNLIQHSYDTLQTSFITNFKFPSADIRPETSGTYETAFAKTEQDLSISVPPTDLIQHSYDSVQTSFITNFKFSSADIRPETSSTYETAFAKTEQDLSVSAPPTDLIQHSYDSVQTSFITNFKFPSADNRPETSVTYETVFAKTEQDLSVSVPPTDLIQHSYDSVQTSFITNFKFPSADIRPETSGTYETAFAKTEQDSSVPVASTHFIQHSYDILQTSLHTAPGFSSDNIRSQTSFAMTEQNVPVTLSAVHATSSPKPHLSDQTEAPEKTLPYNTAPGKTSSQRCNCACSTLVSVLNKQKFLEGLLAKLALNKTQLSSYRRKYVSATDDCPISAGLGYLGISILVFYFILIILCDVTRISSTDGKGTV